MRKSNCHPVAPSACGHTPGPWPLRSRRRTPSDSAWTVPSRIVVDLLIEAGELGGLLGFLRHHRRLGRAQLDRRGGCVTP